MTIGPDLYFHVSCSDETEAWQNHRRWVEQTWCSNARGGDSVVYTYGNELIHYPERPYPLRATSAKALRDYRYDAETARFKGELRLPVHSSYKGQTFKFLLGLDEFRTNTDLPFFVGTHTGSYIRIPLLRAVLANIDPDKPFTAGVLTWHPESGEYESGALHVISRFSAIKILNRADDIARAQIARPHWCDDMLVGWFIREMGMHHAPLWRLNVAPADPLPHHPECFHYLFLRGAKEEANYRHYHAMFPEDRP